MLDYNGNKNGLCLLMKTILMRLFQADLSQDHTKVLNSLPVLQESEGFPISDFNGKT